MDDRLAAASVGADASRALRIGALARRVGVARETLRHYERLGLIAPIGRSAANYRLYGKAAERRLAFIRRAQRLGFSLEDIGELLSLHHRAGARAAEAKRITETRLREVEAKIRDLERMRRGLAELTAACSGEGSAAECPILASLAEAEPK